MPGERGRSVDERNVRVQRLFFSRGRRAGSLGRGRWATHRALASAESVIVTGASCCAAAMVGSSESRHRLHGGRHSNVPASDAADGTAFCPRRWHADARRSQRRRRPAQGRDSLPIAAPTPTSGAVLAARGRPAGPARQGPDPGREEPAPANSAPSPIPVPTAAPATRATLIDVIARGMRRSLTSHSIMDYAPARKRSGASPSPCGGRATDGHSRRGRGLVGLAQGCPSRPGAASRVTHHARRT